MRNNGVDDQKMNIISLPLVELGNISDKRKYISDLPGLQTITSHILLGNVNKYVI